MNNQTPNRRMHYGLKRTAPTCRGNTLIPILIALSISTVASIAFLKQGADLSKKQKQINAPIEAFEYLQEWINLRKQKQFHYQITPAELSFHDTQNVLGYLVRYVQGTATGDSSIFEYPTNNEAECMEIKSIFEKHGSKDSANDRMIKCGNWHPRSESSNLVLEFKR